MIPFTKPGASAPCHHMGAQATREALHDAGLDYRLVEQAYNNHCATGFTALFLAQQAVESGAVECALALGRRRLRRSPSRLAATRREIRTPRSARR